MREDFIDMVDYVLSIDAMPIGINLPFLPGLVPILRQLVADGGDERSVVTIFLHLLAGSAAGRWLSEQARCAIQEAYGSLEVDRCKVRSIEDQLKSRISENMSVRDKFAVRCILSDDDKKWGERPVPARHTDLPETSNHGGYEMNSRRSEGHYTGCLLGGACGDALGWPVEFENLERIRQMTDQDGVTGMTPGKDGLYEITDDTQMTLFTAEGLLRALNSARAAGSPPDFVAALKRSYLCWLATQGERGAESYPKGEAAGWLLGVEGLHEERGPGNTCLSALRATRFSGKDIAANDSKGCGGVMRAAPAGLLASRLSGEDICSAAGLAFEMGWQSAAITHGNPSGYFPAAVLAATIACIVRGESIQSGVERSLGLLKGRQDSGETTAAVQSALDLAQDRSLVPSPETVQTLGAGWIGSEALAIGLYCALVAGDDFARGVRLAVNHSGDSDSTGSITGNLMGVLLGAKSIPPEWLAALELGDVIRQVASDLLVGVEETADWLIKYPAI